MCSFSTGDRAARRVGADEIGAGMRSSRAHCFLLGDSNQLSEAIMLDVSFGRGLHARALETAATASAAARRCGAMMIGHLPSPAVGLFFNLISVRKGMQRSSTVPHQTSSH
jgi:hypothetical protein